MAAVGNSPSFELEPDVSWAKKLRQQTGLDHPPKTLRRAIVGVIGGTLLLIGIALILLPGPAFLVIPFGLLILASEFAWARWLLRRGQKLFRKNNLEVRPPCRPTF